MDTRNIIKNSFLIMLHTKLRTGLTMLGIIIGISSVIIVSSVGKGQLLVLKEAVGSLLSNKYSISVNRDVKNYKVTDSTYLTPKELETISHNPNIEGITIDTFIWSGAIKYLDAPSIMSRPNATLTDFDPVTHGFIKTNNYKLLFGTNFDLYEDRNFAVIDEKLSEKVFHKTDSVGKVLRINNMGRIINLIVIGVVKNPYFLADKIKDGEINRYIVAVPYRYAMKYSLQRKKRIPSYSVKFKPNTNIKIVLPMFLKELSSLKGTPEGVFIAKPAKNSYSGMIETVKQLNVFVFIVSLVALIVGGIGIMDIMMVTINERIDEIGLRKAIGAKSSHILFQFLLESVILTSVGGIFGIIIGLLGCFIAGAVCYIPPIIDWNMLILSVFVSIIIGIVFGLYPAYKAAKMNPIDALREEL